MKKNLVYSWLYEFIIAFYPILLIPYLSATIGKSGIGMYSYTNSIMGYFLMVCQLGVNTCGTRAIAQTRDDKVLMTKTFKSIFAIQLSFGVITSVVYFFFFIVIDNSYSFYFLLLLPFLIGQSIRISWLFLGLEELQVILARNVFIRILSVILIVLLVKEDKDLPFYFVIMSGTYLLGDISVWPRAFRILADAPFDIRDSIRYIKPMLLLFLPILALRGAYYIDETMLGLIRGIDDVGIYENAHKIINIPLQLYTVLSNVLTAQASYLIAAHNKTKNNAYVINSIDFSSAIMIPIIIGLVSIAQELVPWYMGTEFLPAIQVMHILPFVLIFSGVNSILRTQYFIPMNQDAKYIATTFIGIAINVVLNLIFIIHWSYNGVALATVVSELVVTGISCGLVKKDLAIQNAFRNFSLYILAAGAMAAVVRLIGIRLNSGVLTTVVQVLAGIMVYFALLFFIQARYCKKEDITLYNIVKNNISNYCSKIGK